MKNIVLHGDCLELMKNISDESIDMILCDLPYGTTACKWDSVIPFDKLWEQYDRVIRPNGFIVLTASQPFTTLLISSKLEWFSHQWIWEKEQGSNPLLANVMPMKNFEDIIVFYKEYKKYDYNLKNPLREYSKNIFSFIGKNKKQIFKDMGNQSVCHFMRFETIQFSLCTEKCYKALIDLYRIDKMDNFKNYSEILNINSVFESSLPNYQRIYNPQMTEGKRYVSGGGYIQHTDSFIEGGTVSETRYPTSILKFNTNKNKSLHPTQKPVALFEYLIKTYSNEGDTILDNCAGSGTTGVACINTNRNYILIEKEKKYHEIILNRLGIVDDFSGNLDF